MQEQYIENTDSSEAELETLSLSDLATYDAAEWEEFNNDSSSSRGLSQSSSSVSSFTQQDYDFEFFSEEWSTTSPSAADPLQYHPPENIIFCGKLITSKNESNPTMILTEDDHQSRLDIINRRNGLFRWNTLNSPSKEINGLKKNRKQRYYTTKNDSSVHQKMATILTSPSKSRWFMFFTAARIPAGGAMELRDIKSRQSRQSPSSSPLFQFKGDGDRQGVVDLNRKRSKRFWGLIRALGCGSYHQATTIQASIKSIPRV